MKPLRKGYPYLKPRRSQALRNDLAMGNDGLVRKAVQQMYHRRPAIERFYPREDAYADGMVGLMRAAELFDASRGWQFSTYAWYWVKQALQNGYARNGHVFRLPRHCESPPVLTFDPDAFDFMEDRRDDGDETHRRELSQAVRDAVRRLPGRTAAVILMRLDGRTLQEIADELGVTRERVRQIQQKSYYVLSRLLRRFEGE